MSKTNLDGFESRFMIPGLYNDINVVILPRKFLTKKYGKSLKKGEILNGMYDHDNCTIYIAKELSTHLREQVLWHEFFHYIEHTTKELNEELRCDLVGNYLARLYRDREFRNAIKKVIQNKRLK